MLPAVLITNVATELFLGLGFLFVNACSDGSSSFNRFSLTEDTLGVCFQFGTLFDSVID